jgi:hypothetical protein
MTFNEMSVFVLVMVGGIFGITMFIFVCAVILSFLRTAEPITEPTGRSTRNFRRGKKR